MKLKILALFIVFGITGCVSVKMNSFVDSDFRGKTYKKIVVLIEMPYLDLRNEAENIFVERFNDKTYIKCSSSLQLIPPTKDYTDEEFTEVLKNNGYEGVLSVIQTDYHEDYKYIPESKTTTTTGDVKANTYYYGNMATTDGKLKLRSETTKSGGYFVSLPRMRHEIRLIDFETGKVAWLGAAYSKCDRYAEWDNVFKSLSKKTVKMLIRDGLVIEKDD